MSQPESGATGFASAVAGLTFHFVVGGSGHGTSENGPTFSRSRSLARVDLFVLSSNAVVDQQFVAGETLTMHRSSGQRIDDGTGWVWPQQRGQPRALSSSGGLERVVGQILPRSATTTTASESAEYSRSAGRSRLLRSSGKGTGRASGTQRQRPSP